MAQNKARCQRVWVFDLDETLHNSLRHIIPYLRKSMTLYLQTKLNLDEAAASQLRVEYWRRYGLTLMGMVRHHGTDPRHFLSETHRFPDLPGMILREPLVRTMLQRLPGRKIIFSNSPQKYTKAVVKILRIKNFFEDVVSLEQMRYRPKPASYGFLHLIGKLGLNLRLCVMVEDQLRNLKIAKKLGMKTIWVSRSTKCPAFVDIKITSVLHIPRHLDQLEFAPR